MDFGFGFDTPAPCHTARAADSIAPRIPPGRAMSNGLAAISYGLSDISYGLWAMGHGPWAMVYRLWAMDYGSPFRNSATGAHWGYVGIVRVTYGGLGVSLGWLGVTLGSFWSTLR